MAKTILIIKLGYCETLVREEGFIPSLGDVFRHTVLLHRYRKDRVTWLTSTSAAPLLRNNPGIQELLLYEENVAAHLAGREFDEIICLEKASVICKLAKSVKARKRFGFGRNGDQVDAHPLAQSALDIANGRNPYLPIQALLYQMVGDYWRGEDYLLGYIPRPHAAYDVGFNYCVGSKWPTKAWPMAHWKALDRLCTDADMTVSWQEGERDIEHYMDWIHGGTLIVTCDSLGMHLGLALKKKVIALFGPTPSEQIYMYGRGVIVRSDWACPRTPCMLAECERGGACMSETKPESVFRIIQNLLGHSGRERLPSTDGWEKKPESLLPQTAVTP